MVLGSNFSSFPYRYHPCLCLSVFSMGFVLINCITSTHMHPGLFYGRRSCLFTLHAPYNNMHTLTYIQLIKTLTRLKNHVRAESGDRYRNRELEETGLGPRIVRKAMVGYNRQYYGKCINTG